MIIDLAAVLVSPLPTMFSTVMAGKAKLLTYCKQTAVEKNWPHNAMFVVGLL